MYNKEAIEQLCHFINAQNGIADKAKLAPLMQEKFNLTNDRRVYYNDSFAIRFCQSATTTRSFSNTVLSLSALQKYDHKPFVICLVTPNENFLMLANATFLKKISHSSHELRKDNIRGSFNGSDILQTFGEKENTPENFEYLFASHQNYTFAENLTRLVETTNHIIPVGKKFEPNEGEINQILKSVDRAVSFLKSPEYRLLNEDLREKVNAVSSEIVIAAFIDNVNLRGRIIEYLITAAGDLKTTLISSLKDNRPLPPIFTADKLGDYERDFGTYLTATDIKTKIMFRSSNPKGYNIDKVLQFLSQDNSVYLVYIVAIDSNKKIKTQLCSMFNRQLLYGTQIIKHWAGRNSRGVTQFNGDAIESIIDEFDATINVDNAHHYIQEMLNQ